MTARLQIGQLLVRQGRIDSWQLQSALAHQRRWGGRLGQAIVSLGFLPEAAVLAEVARQLGVPFLELGDRYVPPAIVKLIPEKLIRRYRIFPLALASQSRRGPLVVATPEPQNLAALDDVAFATGLVVKPVLASDRDVERAIARHLDVLDPRDGEGAVSLPAGAAGPIPIVPFGHPIH